LHGDQTIRQYPIKLAPFMLSESKRPAAHHFLILKDLPPLFPRAYRRGEEGSGEEECLKTG